MPEPSLELVKILLDGKVDVSNRSLSGCSTFESVVHNHRTYTVIHDHLLKQAKLREYDKFTLIGDISLGLEQFQVPMMNFTSSVDVWNKLEPFYYVRHVHVTPEILDK